MNTREVNKTIILTAERNSICAADDIYGHKHQFEFDGDTRIMEIIERIGNHKAYENYGGAVWAGDYTNHKCIRND